MMQTLKPQTQRERLLAAARCYIGTPYKAVGYSDAGMNCLALMARAARDIGREDIWRAFKPYAMIATPQTKLELFTAFKKYLRILPYPHAEGGDVLLFKWADDSLTHVGFKSDRPGYIIHADQLVGKVTEAGIRPNWRPPYAFRVEG